jgi:hypothetical protein
MAETRVESRPVQMWMDVLDRIEQSLQESLARTSEPSANPPEGMGAGAAALRVLDERLTRWQECLEQTSEDATQAEAQVAAEENALAEVIGRIGPAREKLANLGKRAG